VPVSRGDVDDAAAALLPHDAHLVLHAEQDAEDVRVERRGVGVRGLVGDRPDLAFGARVVHRDVETAEPGDGLVHQGADVVLPADIGVDELGLDRAVAGRAAQPGGSPPAQARATRLAGHLAQPARKIGGQGDLTKRNRWSHDDGARTAVLGVLDRKRRRSVGRL
jgi:hypothetical protein